VADIVELRVYHRATHDGTSAPRAFKSVWKLQLPLDPLEARLIAQRTQKRKALIAHLIFQDKS
jgi:hypothetical protein